MEKLREGQKELHCIFVSLEKACDNVPREELWCCMRKSGDAQKYVKLVQDMYSECDVAKCAVGTTDEFMVEEELHQSSALCPLLLAPVDTVTDLERWSCALERRGMKV